MERKMICQTKFKITVLAIFLFFIEGIVRAIAQGFPFVELVASQGAVIGYFLTVKIIGDTKESNNVKNGN